VNRHSEPVNGLAEHKARFADANRPLAESPLNDVAWSSQCVSVTDYDAFLKGLRTRSMMRFRMAVHVVVAVAASSIAAASAGAQSASFAQPYDSALTACVAAAAKKDKGHTKAVTEAAERHYRSLMESTPHDPDLELMLARTLSQCRTSYAGVFSLEGIVNESNDLLRGILAKDSTSWDARYTLALNHYHTPAFFGRQDDAAREFERLIAQQRSSTLFPELAKPYAYLGDLYLKSNRKPDAIAIWRRGSALFPNDSMLIRRLAKHAVKDTQE
jgi:tetratricopeptide (TPR) repeat protein